MEHAMRELLLKSRVAGVYGDPDSGKTFFMLVLAWWMLKFGTPDKPTYVISNVPLVKWNGTREVEASWPNYIVVSTFADMFLHISELIYRNRETRFLVLLDEAGVRFGKASWSTVLTVLLRSALTVVRKFNIFLVFASVSEKILVRDLREDEALVQVKFYKGGYMLRKHAPEILDTVDNSNQAVLVHWPVKGIFHEPLFVGPKDSLAVPFDQAREQGKVYFDSKGVSDWSVGLHPVTGKMFLFDSLLNAVKGIGWDVPEKLYQFMNEAQVLPDVVLDETMRADDMPVPVSVPRGKQQKDRAVELLLEGLPVKHVATETGLSPRRIYQIRRVLRQEGKL